MSFKSILKKIEEDVLKAGTIVATIEGFEPVVKAFLPRTKFLTNGEEKVDVTLGIIDNIVSQVHVMGTASGMTNDQKLDAETALIAQLVRDAGHLGSHEIGDAAEVQAGLRDMIKGWVRFKNGLKAN